MIDLNLSLELLGLLVEEILVVVNFVVMFCEVMMWEVWSI